ncbi:MAG: hypothetical protein R3D65_00325 [Zhengella sp.]|uniref:hypothetical protein n=1 Tax=Zhengella sp. TaxID=2282762 RepID=UPI0035297687
MAFSTLSAVRALRHLGRHRFRGRLAAGQETFFQTLPAGTDILFFLVERQIQPDLRDEVQRSSLMASIFVLVGNSVDSAQLDLLDDRSNNSQTVVSDSEPAAADAVIDISSTWPRSHVSRSWSMA